MLEIGSCEGRSAVWFLENILTHPTARIVCAVFFTALPLIMRVATIFAARAKAIESRKLKGHADAIPGTLTLNHFDIIVYRRITSGG